MTEITKSSGDAYADLGLTRPDDDTFALLRKLNDAALQAQKEVERLREEVVFGFYEDEVPEFVQGYSKATSEILTPVTALECNGYIQRIYALQNSLSVGWLYHNPDTGTELSENHPVKSGEVPDAERIQPATAENLKTELLLAWKRIAELERQHD